MEVAPCLIKMELVSAVHPEFGILAAYCLLKTDEEARGVSILYDIVKSVPWSQLDYNALVVQAQFLLRKEQADLATKVALSIVERNPVEPRGWLTLSVAWVANEKPHHALRALNSCPMVRPLPVPYVLMLLFFDLKKKNFFFFEGLNSCAW